MDVTCRPQIPCAPLKSPRPHKRSSTHSLCPVALAGRSLISELGAEAEPAQQHTLHIYRADLGARDEERRKNHADDSALEVASDLQLGEREGNSKVDAGEIEHVVFDGDGFV